MNAVTKTGEGSDGYNRKEGAERLDRKYDEMLQEVRVAQIGVQILFAFLLGIAFTQSFTEITSLQRTIYVLTLIFTAVAVALLTAPVAVHRALSGKRRKNELVTITSKLQMFGMAFMLVSILGAVLLVLDHAVGLVAALIIDGGLGIVFLYLWAVLPVRARATTESEG